MTEYMPCRSPWDDPGKDDPPKGKRAANCNPSPGSPRVNQGAVNRGGEPRFLPPVSPWEGRKRAENTEDDGQEDLTESTRRAGEIIAAIRQLQQRIVRGNQQDGNPGMSADVEAALRGEIEDLKRELLALASPTGAANARILSREVVENGRKRLDIYVPTHPNKAEAPLVNAIIEATSPPGERLYMAPRPPS